MPRTLTLHQRLRRIRLLTCDVDGVLTDGGVYIMSDGEAKRFHVPDGLALRCWQLAGLRTAWISARPSAVTTKRAEELKTDFIEQTKDGKVPALRRILKQAKLDWDQVAFVGDDLVDLAVMKRVGLAVAPANACPEAREIAHLTTDASGGHGAVRELVEKILKAQRKWDKVVKQVAR
ncbi:MAG: KdsC family phosphatase [Limisphaerales bacterium]